MDAVWSFLITAFALAGSPGPNTLSVAAVGASYGRSRGIEYMAGLNIGVAAVILIVGTGVAGAVLAVPGIAPVITALAIAYFLYLAWRIATAPPLAEIKSTGATAGPRWHAGVVLSLANPKAYAAMGALFSGHVFVPGILLVDGLWIAALAIFVNCIVNLCWLMAGAGMARLLSDPRASRTVNVVFALLLLASVALVAVG